jgi:hypothetical protein
MARAVPENEVDLGASLVSCPSEQRRDLLL